MGTERVLQAGKRLAAALEKYKFLLLVLLAGLLLLLLPSSGGTQGAEPAAAQAEEAFLSLAELEEKLARTLSKIEGAGEVTVALTLRSGARQVLAQDVAESDRDGVRSQERTTVVLSGGSGREEPVALQQLAPQFQGAVVVCPGGEDPAVQLRLVEAVADLTGLGTYRITICKGR